MIVFGHAGRWAVQLLYAAPLLFMVSALVVGRMRERHRSDGDRDSKP